MIEITSVTVEGVSSRGPFAGSLSLAPGLNVLSANNAYGKSLAMTAIPWCLGLEVMFGLQDNDTSRFPTAVRDVVDLGDAHGLEVVSSVARVTLRRDDGATLTISRPIKGASPSAPEVVEVVEGGVTQRTSRLQARRRTMKDETGGLQYFLFEWLKLPRAPLMNLRGEKVEIYLENLAPLFFIDQDEGWTDLQALQIYRYQIQEVSDAAVEYLLGATGALTARFHRQENVSLEARLKGEAETLSKQTEDFFRRTQGWDVKLSVHGAPGEIAARWSKRTLSAIAHDEFRLDIDVERKRLDARVLALRKELASDPVGSSEAAPSIQASQQVVEIKTRRHQLRSSLRDSRMQLADQQALLETTEHRIHSSKDVLRLKKQGIGRLETVECPTCHRHLEPSTFKLSDQSEPSVEAHIASLEKQRMVLIKNIRALEVQITRLDHDVAAADAELVAADRALETVNRAVGSARERLAKVASDLTAAERSRDALLSFASELKDLEGNIIRWLEEAAKLTSLTVAATDLSTRIATFEEKLRAQLLALGFSAVDNANAETVVLDDRYVPYRGPRRLRSLGSASDHARLVAAYVLALADASRANSGPHPGVVVLDEPLQQNPDPAHRDLMLRFFEKSAASTKNQVIVTTSLRPEELDQVRKAGVRVTALEGEHFLAARPTEKPETTRS